MSPDGQRISDWLAKGQGRIDAATEEAVLEKAYASFGKKHMTLPQFRDRLALAGYKPEQRIRFPTDGTSETYYSLILPEHFSR